jgi:hypothetical protein
VIILPARTTILTLSLVLAIAAPAAAEPKPIRWGDFVTMMQGNTLSGTTAAGMVFNMYFVAGGNASYEAADGTRDRGTWHLDKDGDVCVTWQNTPDQGNGCFRVTVDGNKVAWEGKDSGGSGLLRGGVSDTFLKPVGQ